MQTFKLLNGTIVTVDRFMQGPAISKNHFWYDENGIWAEKGCPLETIDVNKETLFGYDQKEFLQKQYK